MKQRIRPERNITPEGRASWSLHAKARAAENLERDPEFYQKLGRKGGVAKVPKGFAVNRELARMAGTMGGSVTGKGKNQKARYALSGNYESQGIKLTRQK